MVLERLGPPLIQLNLSKNLKSFYVLSVWYGEFISSISIFAQVQMKLSSTVVGPDFYRILKQVVPKGQTIL